MKTVPPQTLIMRMREEGKQRDDAGFFEIDLMENRVTWANSYAVNCSGYTMDQIKHMTLFDLVPEPFHTCVQNAVSSAAEKECDKSATSIWPIATPSGKIIWWATTRIKVEYPIIWFSGDHIQTTNMSGMSYLFMQAFMRATNGQAGLFEKMSDIKAWTEEQIARIDEEQKSLKNHFMDLESKVDDIISTSKESMTIVRNTHDMMTGLQKSWDAFQGKYDVEILKLIGTDAVHDKRIDAFEKHIKVTTDLAMKSIEMQTNASVTGIQKQTEESSKGLNRKVVIPISILAGIVTILQILAERFFK